MTDVNPALLLGPAQLTIVVCRGALLGRTVSGRIGRAFEGRHSRKAPDTVGTGRTVLMIIVRIFEFDAPAQLAWLNLGRGVYIRVPTLRYDIDGRPVLRA